MSQIKTFRGLLVWQKAMVLVIEIYKVTQEFPQSEMYGLTSQIRRSAVSIPSNIAEGYGRNATGDYRRFLQIAIGSLFELQTQLEVSFNIKYLQEDSYNQIVDKTNELDRMLFSLVKKIN